MWHDSAHLTSHQWTYSYIYICSEGYASTYINYLYSSICIVLNAFHRSLQMNTIRFITWVKFSIPCRNIYKFCKLNITLFSCVVLSCENKTIILRYTGTSRITKKHSLLCQKLKKCLKLCTRQIVPLRNTIFSH